ncbi:aspartate/glutamate racemase family protein [Algibacter amylolyticus]|uniref:Aspartate/glutamate racemase family protein n=1 Tax=Algibacter amylolyticus TaxID=1608400 RepID=A0A5M7BGK5_9FLAO|nr:aspartate/glutamate racemase family protein [Algibacter amylolyticus]KAA5827930.1 aspartate/glutamate racemase family protein [Algibacter amylolyticus]MBB5267164.1 aspartate racemase [Algibacter amylolyticus]TSJ82175.1 aspartate/glutamate racemase family protein [Algibacter amylolyticus]
MDSVKLAVLGLGSQTTTFYISELNRLYNDKYGGYSTCPLIMWNANFDAINSLLPNISEELNSLTQGCINEIEKLDISHILVPNITLHESIDQIEVRKTILHPVYLTVAKIKILKLSKVVLMASEYTMNSAYVRSVFNANKIEIEIPSEEDRLQIDTFRKQVYAKKETEEVIVNFHEIVEKYTVKTTVLLACTELSVFKPKNNKRLLDMVEIQIMEAINVL